MLTAKELVPSLELGAKFLEHRMFDHVEYSVGDFSAAHRFYVPIFEAIGAHVAFLDEELGELGIEKEGIVQFLITRGAPTQPKIHICFRAPDKEAVQKAYDGAIAGGGICNGKPGYRDHYAPGYYAAFVFDPDGHNVEVLFRETLPGAS